MISSILTRLAPKCSPIDLVQHLLVFVSGVLSAKGPDSSVGGVPVVYCPDVDHIEEEVQLTVLVEEGIGETHGKEQGEEQRVKERTTAQRG